MRFILTSAVLTLGVAAALGAGESPWAELALVGVVASVVACLIQDVRELGAAG